MTKIPIKIVELTSPSGKSTVDVMIDVFDYEDIENAQKKIKNFKKEYFDIIKKVKEILPEKKSERKPSNFWKIGKILYDFDKSIENTFEITNYQDAINRDFSLYRKRMVGLLLQFGKEFVKTDVSDSISISHYIELIWHANMLIKLKLFEQEKKDYSVWQKTKHYLIHMNIANNLIN